MALFRILYTICYTLLIPFIIIRLYIKSIKLPQYRQRVSERFGIYHNNYTENIDIWIHAVSLGESIAVSSLINKLLQKNKKVLVTNMTPTGSDYITKRFKNDLRNVYVPYDIPWIIKRFLKKFNIKKVIIVETELWPNLILTIHKHKIPLYLINARLSEKSLRGYGYMKFIMQPIIKCFTMILTQDTQDKARFLALGAKHTNVINIGNIKYDQNITIKLSPQLKKLKQLWQNNVVVLAASTHEPEEKMLLEQFDLLKQHLSNAILLIAPRHPERFETIFNLAKQYNNNVSKITSLKENSEIVIIDSFGDLLAYYTLANFAFVGGSWSQTGGHNILEPIGLNIPTFTGKNTWNFSAMITSFKKHHAIIITNNAKEFYQKIIDLQHNPIKIKKLTDAAKIEFLKHQGATLKIYNKIS